MLTLPIPPAAPIAWKVSDGEPLLTLIPRPDGGLSVVFADGREKLVAAEHREHFLRLCRNCESLAELLNWMDWTIPV